jgi:hypothetical protein
MYRALGYLGIVLGLNGVTTMAVAEGKNAPPKFAVPGSPASISAGGKDASAHAHARKDAKARDAALATFPGFRVLPDGKSRIYVELTKAVSVDERRADGMLIYVLHGARVPVRNNRNALITTHFSTPVARARLLTQGSDVELVIDLRQAANATQKVVPADNGAARLEIDFAAGDYPPVPGLFEPPAAKRRSNDSGDGDEPEPQPAVIAAPPATAPAASGASPARPSPNAPASPPSP